VTRRAHTFVYERVHLDAEDGTISCHYRSDDVAFVERATFDATIDLSRAGVRHAARSYFLLAGLSYYKTGAASTVELDAAATTADRALVAGAIQGGLAEFAYRNGLDLSDVDIVGGDTAATPASLVPADRGPLIPFGGGIDSIVTVVTGQEDDAALFVVGPRDVRFEAIERPALVTGLDVVRCTRALDAQVLERRDGWFDGHVPVTAMLSALAICAAIGQGRRAVIMSNERSASVPNLVVAGRAVNHQWSKSWEAEELLRGWLASSFDAPIPYYSALRDRSELWVAKEFASHPEYLEAFMSCNRAFRQDATTRATTWCGSCDKCLFIDLILAPFVDRARLETLFSGDEPLVDAARTADLEVLVGLADHPKPFECVGDVDECATALVATAARPDRGDQAPLSALAARCVAARPLADLLVATGPTNAPVRDAARDLL
jgi:UDP-N-acetyl-alpha-D-muramoyl-L-alanyl-L-glutamate epimerase